VSVLGYTAVRLPSLAVLAIAIDVFLEGNQPLTGGTAPDTLTLVGALGLVLVGYLSGGLFHAVFYRELGG